MLLSIRITLTGLQVGEVASPGSSFLFSGQQQVPLKGDSLSSLGQSQKVLLYITLVYCKGRQKMLRLQDKTI